jgi:hypothetical protein
VESPQWECLLQGSLRDRALEAAGSIAVDLAQFAPPQLDLERTFSHSLAYGGAGIALFLHYWDSALPDRCIRHSAEQYLDQVIAGMEERRMSCALFRGFTGIAWAALHVYRRWGEVLAAPVWAHLDQAVDAWTHRHATPTELLEGLGGILLYLAERDVEPVTQALFERVVARLHQVALERGAGRAWPVADWLQKDYEWHLTLSSRERFQLSDHWLQQGMRGYYKLGVAHGCTGTAAALAAASVAGYEAPGAAHMAASAAQFVLSQRLPAGSQSIFPNVAGTILPKLTGGWCDGDIGIAATLVQIAQSLERDDLRAQALEIARLEAVRRVDEVEAPNRNNYMLCHGACGRGHVFNRLYHTTGEALFAEAAIYWFELALAVRTAGRGTGGFLVDEQRRDGALLNVRGFLMGAAGLGLALTAACCDDEPQWDRLLLLSGRRN